MLLVPVMVSGERAAAVVDTGSVVSAYDVTLRPLLGKVQGRTLVVTPQGRRWVQLFSPPVVHLGRIRVLQSELVGCIDLNELRKASSLDYRAVIGMDALASFAVRYDARHGRLSLLDSRTLARVGGVAIDFIETAPYLSVPFRGAAPEAFLIDTGAASVGSGAIRQELFTELMRRGQLSPYRDLIVTGIAGSRSVRRGELRTAVEFAGRKYQGLVFSESDHNALTLRFFENEVVTFDFPNRRLFLSDPTFEHPRLLRSGVRAVWKGDDVVIDSLDRSASVRDTGLRTGDVVESVDGVPVASERAETDRHTPDDPSPTVLTINRGGRRYTAVIPTSAPIRVNRPPPQSACASVRRPSVSLKSARGE